MTVAAALAIARATLDPFDAKALLARIAGKDAAWLIAHGDSELDAATESAFRDALARRSDGYPQAYLDGAAGFYGRSFTVNESVLIPRPETELLVDDVLRSVARDAAVNVLDVGTGSGILAVTLALELQRAAVRAVDVSVEALEVARANAQRHGASNVQFVQGDLLRPFERSARFDVVVANLPYVPGGDVPRVPDSVGYEPRLALDGGADGLDLYRRLLSELPGYLNVGGLVLLEAAPPTIAGLRSLAQAAFSDAAVTVIKDYAGLDRYVRVK